MARIDTTHWGEAFFRSLVTTRNIEALETLWRADEPALSAKLVGHMAATRNVRLGGLLLDEHLAPRHPAPLVAQIARIISSASPPALSKADAARLVSALRSQPAGPNLANRVGAERWALSQTAPEVLAFAKEILVGETSYSGHEEVLKLARQRVIENPKARDEVVGRLVERMSNQPTVAAWAMAAGFLDRLPADVNSAAIRRLTDKVVDDAPRFQQALTPALSRRVAAAPDRVEHLLSQAPIAHGAGGQALVQVIEAVEDPETRGRMTALVVLRHPELYRQYRRIRERWSDEEWAIRLAGLATVPVSQPNPNSSLTDFFTAAPHIHAALTMRVASCHGAAESDTLRAAVVAKVRARYNESVEGGFGREAVDAVAWPSTSDDHLLPLTKMVLKEAIPDTARGVLVGKAVVEGALPARLTGVVLDPSYYPGVLSPGDLQGKTLQAVAISLYDAAPDAMNNIVRMMQGKAFNLDLARAIAPRSPAAAFAGAAAAYANLSDDAKNDLLDLLDKHGSWEQEDLLTAAAETTGKAAQRRLRVIEMTGRFAPTDQAVPGFVTDAVSTGRQDLREATFATIARLRPRDIELVRRLRDMADAEGGPGRTPAVSALDALASAYVSALATTTAHDEQRLLLTLLGASARTEAIDTLLRYLGGEAEEDHPSVRRAAAEGLAEAARTASFTVEQKRLVGDHLDGPEQEADPKARALLLDVIGRATMGEDQALLVLYDLIKIKPKSSPDQLFGQEKARLLRHADLYQSSTIQGEAGWPGVIQQLDIMALFVARAAYLAAGSNEPPKDEIRLGDPNRPTHGALLNMLTGSLSKAKGPLEALHLARNTMTEYSHPGTKPTDETVTAARDNFKAGVTILVGILEKDAQSSP